MKKNILIALALVVVSVLLAQGMHQNRDMDCGEHQKGMQKGHQMQEKNHDGNMMMMRMMNQLELTEEQQEDMADLRLEIQKSMISMKAEIETLRRWIEAGAEYETHWSFVAPVRPRAPSVEDNGWSRSDIDRFVYRRLQDRNLSPSPQADSYTLVRRAYLDLIGLPPTPEAADAFAAKPTPEAFAAIVDELLESPRFGEHWASMWLDLARYADTKGYEKDLPRDIWRYRDWVIEALNSDMPFDQFTVEQIAGDLLDNSTTNQILATAFHRNTMTNDEGGTDNEEFRILAVKDRVDRRAVISTTRRRPSQP